MTQSTLFNEESPKQKLGKEQQLEHAQRIYAEYPRKVGRTAAIKSIIKAMKEVDPERLLNKVKMYADCKNGSNKQYIPHPATWFNQGRYDDDPSEWRIGNGSAPAKPPRFVLEKEYQALRNKFQQEADRLEDPKGFARMQELKKELGL